MPRSAALRLADLRAIHQLVGECRELGDDPKLWRLHLFVVMARFTNGGVVMGGEVQGLRTGRMNPVGFTDWGWENGFDRIGWECAQAELLNNPNLVHHETFFQYLTRTTCADGACLARTDLITDSAWDCSWDFQNMVKPARADHSLYCYRSTPQCPGRHEGIIIARSLGDRDFSSRDKAIVAEAMAQIAPLVGGPLARFSEPSPAILPPRVRQVLRCLLEGDADKQIVSRLGLTRNTVNQHIKTIFIHFGVRSRSELLAQWIRRGWGNRFAWADESLPTKPV